MDFAGPLNAEAAKLILAVFGIVALLLLSAGVIVGAAL